jgi:hypothetical protein
LANRHGCWLAAISEAIIKIDEASEQVVAGDSFGYLPIKHVRQLAGEAKCMAELLQPLGLGCPSAGAFEPLVLAMQADGCQLMPVRPVASPRRVTHDVRAIASVARTPRTPTQLRQRALLRTRWP